MDKELLIIKNITREGPGILEYLLKEKRIGYSVIDLDKVEKLPSPQDFGAVVVLGGPDSANDTSEKILNELIYIRSVLSAGLPYLGICLGLQLMVKAAGGKVVRNSVSETGFRDPDNNFFAVNLTSEGRQDPLFQGLGNEFLVFHLHGETVELTGNMSLLATGKFCRNQIVKTGEKAYGIQCHFELTTEMFEEWITTDPDLLKLKTEGLRQDFRLFQDEYTSTGKSLLENFLRIAGY
jgi:GMP synthase-like glutamine amidotransferase